MAGHWWTLAMEYAAELKMIVLESAHTLHLLGRARRSGSDSQHRRHGVLGGAGSDLRHCQCRRGIGPQEEVRRHRLVRPAQQLRRDRAVNATADVQNAMVLGFCLLCLLVAGGAPWAIPCPGEDVVATPGAAAGAVAGAGTGTGFGAAAVAKMGDRRRRRPRGSVVPSHFCELVGFQHLGTVLLGH